MNEQPAKSASTRGTDLLRLVFLLASILPWVCTASIYGFAWYVRDGFGAWPVAHKDAVDLALVDTFLPMVFALYQITTTALPLVWGGLFVTVVVAKQGQKATTPSIIFASGLALLMYLSKSDPWGFQAWLFN
jgi:hypothetical protein